MSSGSPLQTEDYLALALVPGVGSTRFAALLERFGTPLGALSAPFEFLRTVPGVSTQIARAIGAARREGVRSVLEALNRVGGQLLLPDDPRFPPILREIPEPPLYLFAEGNLSLLDRPAIAIVGSRDHSAYGLEVCRALARGAADLGLVVVSGMARGLDAVAHQGALDAGGGSIGVLGCGIGVTYPRSNHQLYQRMRERGLLLTEESPGKSPGEGSFPRRNRLISALGRITVVVEAAVPSGASQTVECALAQNKTVLAVPGPITSPVSAGTNRLIRDGATPLLELDDLLEHFPEAERKGGAPAPADLALAPLEGRIVNALWAGPRRTDELIEVSGAPVWEALDALSTLELAGRIEQLGGGRYRLAPTRLFEPR